MKNVITLCSLLLCFGLSTLSAQNYETAMQANLQKMGMAQQADEFVAVSQIFERISNAEHQKWEPAYYAALTLINGSYKGEGKELRDRLLDQAQVFIDTCNDRSHGNSEVMTLQGYLYQARIGVDGSRGLIYSQKAASRFKEALIADERNPRATCLLAMNVMHTPKFFGGGKENALPLFEQAAAFFESQQKGNPFSPTWGSEMNKHFLEVCQH